MKIKQLIDSITEEAKEPACLWNVAESIFNGDHYGFDLNVPDEENRMKTCHVKVWRCWDTPVGNKVYFLDGKPVALSDQPYRKSSEHFEWVSVEAFKAVRDYLLNFKASDDDEIPLVDLDEEITDTYKLQSGREVSIQHKKCLWNGVEAAVLNGIECGNKIRLMTENGEKIVGIEEVEFNYHI